MRDNTIRTQLKNAKIETCDDDSDKISKYGRLDGETKHLLDSKLCRP